MYIGEQFLVSEHIESLLYTTHRCILSELKTSVFINIAYVISFCFIFNFITPTVIYVLLAL